MIFKKENMAKEKISASDLATSIYQSVCNGFGIQTSKEDEQELKATFDALFGDAPVDVKSYVDEDGTTVTVASVNMCSESENKNEEAPCPVLGGNPQSCTQYSTPAVAAAKDLIDRMDCATACSKAQAIDDLPKEKNLMSLRDRIFADHRVALQKQEDEKRQAYEQYLVDLVTEKLETNQFEYTEDGVLVEVDDLPTSAVVINVAHVLKADQGWSRIEYMQQNNKTFLRFYF